MVSSTFLLKRVTDPMFRYNMLFIPPYICLMQNIPCLHCSYQSTAGFRDVITIVIANPVDSMFHRCPTISGKTKPDT